MDPNAALATIREWAGIAHGDDVSDELEDGAAGAFLALDEWITRGGFLPADWKA